MTAFEKPLIFSGFLFLPQAASQAGFTPSSNRTCLAPVSSIL
jgi:hypothetical protein